VLVAVGGSGVGVSVGRGVGVSVGSGVLVALAMGYLPGVYSYQLEFQTARAPEYRYALHQ